jgi:hypothetical protein
MARTITISVSDELHEKLKNRKEISISGICQVALKETLKLWEQAPADMDKESQEDYELAVTAATRLREKGEDQMMDLLDKSEKLGKEWASGASREELEELENEGASSIIVQTAFGDDMQQETPDEIWNNQDKNHELLFRFEGGATGMWRKIQELLSKKK